MPFHRSDIDVGADDEQAFRARLESLRLPSEPSQLRHVVGAVQRFLVNVIDRPVGGGNDRQGRGVGLDQQHGNALVAVRLPNRLGQCRGSQERRDQHDLVDTVRGQRVAQRGCL
ncbi:hypothetical protein H7J11_12580 [Mycobacterium bourgelatii]|nr:hypothetical protein [Mycobacterium bourgelatii]MCV6975318.1 hypothetical protein [Mycobacterium bourgelatii]